MIIIILRFHLVKETKTILLLIKLKEKKFTHLNLFFVFHFLNEIKREVYQKQFFLLITFIKQFLFLKYELLTNIQIKKMPKLVYFDLFITVHVQLKI